MKLSYPEQISTESFYRYYILPVQTMRNMIFPYLMREVFEKKGTFYFRLKKKNLDKSDMSINHPNTPFTFD